MLGGGILPYEPPWQIPMPCGNTLELHCDFCDNADSAHGLLFAPDQSKQYEIILLDNSWGADKHFGVNLLRTLSERSIIHPLLFLYTQHDATTEIPLAIKYGAQAVVKKEHKEHFLSVLMSAAVRGLSVHQHAHIDTYNIVAHEVPQAIGNIVDSLNRAHDALSGLEGAPVVTAKQLLTTALSDTDRLENTTEFWTRVAKIAAGRTDVPHGAFDTFCNTADFLAVLRTKLDHQWVACQAHLISKANRANAVATTELPLLTAPAPIVRAESDCAKQNEISYNAGYLERILRELLRNVLKHGADPVEVALGIHALQTDHSAECQLGLTIGNNLRKTSQSQPKAGIMDHVGNIGLSSLIWAADAYRINRPSFEVLDGPERRFVAKVIVAKGNSL